MSAKARMAGDLIEKLFGKGATGLDIGMRVAPDLAFGVLEGVMTPGDLGDKISAELRPELCRYLSEVTLVVDLYQIKS